MATTSKVSFRARALDSNKPMGVYYASELPDLSECAPIARSVMAMPTGMEKDEEMVGGAESIGLFLEHSKTDETNGCPHTFENENVTLLRNFVAWLNFFGLTVTLVTSWAISIVAL